jgi:hypothetical protein
VEDVVGDVIFVVVIVAFFALSVAYVKACERIVGRDTGEALAATDAGGDDAGSPLEASLGRGR